MKKLISFILTITIVVASASILSVNTSAAQQNDMITGTCCGETFYYTDSYFDENASVYNASLATMSFRLTEASNADTSDNYAAPYSTIFSLLSKIGFTNCETNDDYKTKPGTDTIGVACAYKCINVSGKNYTVLAIVPRSLNYEAEWANNFTLGTSGEAEGFSASAKKVENFANAYAEKYECEFVGELKVWVAGYSRGAAVANLVAGHLTAEGKVGNTSIQKENLYGYTFETPRAASTDVISVEEAKTYTNIHNIITANDIVTKVAPANYGFIRYGTDEALIPETRNASNTELFDTAVSYIPEYLAAYNAEGKRILASEQFQAKKISLSNPEYIENSSKTMGEFWDDLITSLCIAVGNRSNYAYLVEDSIRLMTSELVGDGYQSYVWNKAIPLLKSKLLDNETQIIKLVLSLNESELNDLLEEIFNDVVEESGLDVGAYAKVPAQITALVPIIVKMALADVAIDGGADIITLIENLDICMLPHYPDQCAAWLMALDENYTQNAKIEQAKVTDVNVVIAKKTTSKKIFFKTVNTYSYDVNIIPVSGMEVQKIEYRTLKIGKLKTGSLFNQLLKPSYLYISITDAYGNVTHWEYNNGTVKQIK